MRTFARSSCRHPGRTGPVTCFLAPAAGTQMSIHTAHPQRRDPYPEREKWNLVERQAFLYPYLLFFKYSVHYCSQALNGEALLGYMFRTEAV